MPENIRGGKFVVIGLLQLSYSLSKLFVRWHAYDDEFQRAQNAAKTLLELLSPKTSDQPSVGEVLEDAIQAIARGNVDNPDGVLREVFIILGQNCAKQEVGECANDYVTKL